MEVELSFVRLFVKVVCDSLYCWEYFFSIHTSLFFLDFVTCHFS